MSAAQRLVHPVFILAVALLVVPHLLLKLGFGWTFATEVVIFALVGMGYNLLLGYTGLISFGHGMFFGLGACGVALSQLHWFTQSSLWPLLFGLMFATVMAVVIGFLSLRKLGVYFSLLTLVFSALTFHVLSRWTGFTRPGEGLSGLHRETVLGVTLDDPWMYYHFVAGVVLAVATLLWRLTHSPLGTVLVAIREKEQRAQFAGYPVQYYKLIAFTVSAAVAALAGCLYAYLKLFVSIDVVHPLFSGEILMLSVFGGTGHFLGPALGSLAFLIFREVVSGFTSTWLLWFGLVFMAFILFCPQGLVGLGARLLAPMRRVKAEAAAKAARLTPTAVQEVPAFLRQRPPVQGSLVSCDLVEKRFADVVAVAGVDLFVEDRKLHALIGANGAGKTTLFNIISGAYAPDHGAVRLSGMSVGGLPPDEVARRGLARSFQTPMLFGALSVREHIRLAAQAHSRRRFNAFIDIAAVLDVQEEVDALLEYLGLQGLEQTPVAILSPGGQRLVEIGMALAAKPGALLLDEPLEGLAADERARVTALLRGLKQYMGVLIAERDIDGIADIADRVTVMSEGKVLVEGDARTVRKHPTTQHIWSGGAQVTTRRRMAVDARSSILLSVAGLNTYCGKSHILHDVSFDVRQGEVLALLGRNGAGKSAVFQSVLGLLRPQTGTVTLDGKIITGLPPEEIAPLGVGIVPQGRRLFARLSVEENLRMGALGRSRGAGVNWDRERIYACFPRIKERLHSKVQQLSGGEQQMVAIARALCASVKILMLDEPFEGLDAGMMQEIFDAIDQLSRELSILIIDHHLDMVLSLADTAVVLDRGRVSHVGAAQALMADEVLRRKVLW